MSSTMKVNNQDVRQLIINSKEKYRAIVARELIYAKGKINFEINRIRDGSGNLIDYRSSSSNGTIWSSLYCFYNDGFYTYNNDVWTNKGTDLNNINNLTSTAAIFKGWYTDSKKGRKIETIEDIFAWTSLFKYSDSLSMPTITLYAHWEIRTYEATIHNITRETDDGKSGSTSFFKYKGRQTFSNVKIAGIPYNTELISYINKIITSPTYITWARSKLDGTNMQFKLRNGVQKFIGWNTSEWVDGSAVIRSYYVKGNVNIYPKFQALVIWPIIRWNDGATTGCGYRTHNPPMTLEEAKKKVKCSNGGYLPPSPTVDSSHSGKWEYHADFFPLYSANTNVVTWIET